MYSRDEGNEKTWKLSKVTVKTRKINTDVTNFKRIIKCIIKNTEPTK